MVHRNVYVFIDVKTGMKVGTVERLREIPGVEANLITGPFDIIATTEVSTDEMGAIDNLLRQIRGIPGIARTETCVAI